MKFLSVVIPCYNEKENLKTKILDEVRNYLIKQKYDWEVIISDDGSTDKSIELIEKFINKKAGFRLLKNKHQGKPYAVKSGILASEGKYILFSDLDQSTPIKEIKKLLPYFNKGYDIVIGSRGTFRKKSPWYRKIMAYVFLKFRRILILPDIIDTQCGFKCFSQKAAKDIFNNLKIYAKKNETIIGGRVTAFDVEVLFLGKKLGYKVKEIPVEWEYRKTRKIDYFKESISMVQETFRVLINNWRGLYDQK